MRDSARGSGADRERAGVEVSRVSARRRRWSAEEKARIVRESFGSGKPVEDIAVRYGLSRKQLSAWRSRACQGKLTILSSTQPELVVDGCEREPAFATLEFDRAPEPDRGSLGSVSIEARGMTVRLDGDIGAGRIAAIASGLRTLR